jgi:hypothetical protein
MEDLENRGHNTHFVGTEGALTSPRHLLLLVAASFACGGKPRQVFVYSDLQCQAPLPDGGSGPCQQVGDGASYLECDSSGDCPSGAPFCRALGLFNGGDYSCNASVHICRAIDHDDCPP